jgi:hypothetical protein
VSTVAPACEPISGPTGARTLQKVFSFPAMLVGMLAALAVFTVRSRFDDPDMWWHLKTGELIWTSHRIPTTDIFSYTTNHHAYIPHEWLSQLLIFAAYRIGGYSGLMLWLCCFTAAVLIAGYGLCALYSGNAKVAFLGAMVIWMFGTIGLSIRPQMVGYLLLLVELLLLELGRTRDPRWFFALPPLFAIWINCHGSFFLGLILAALLLFSSWFQFQSGSLIATRWEPRRRRILTWALALSGLALFLNPVGAKLILYPLQIMLHSPVNLGAVSEWRPLRLADPRGISFLAVIGSIVLLVIIRRSQLLLHELLILLPVMVVAARHERLVFIFGLVAAPVLCRLLSDFYDQYSVAQDRPLPNAVLLAASVLIMVLAFPNLQNLTAQVEEQSPVKAVEFIETHHLSGRMLNEYVFGGYLIWAAPDHPVFVDGRTDIFEWTGVLQEYGNWATLQSPPRVLLDKYQIAFCLLGRDAPMASVLALLPEWKAVYSDDHSVIFVRTPSPAS